VLIVVGGLPATGKSTLSRTLARELGASYVRVDTIEQALVASGLAEHPVGVAGYAVGYAVAEENLRVGRHVVAESVNPLAVTREAWREHLMVDTAGRSAEDCLADVRRAAGL
jgi:predicted kinase